MPQLDFSLWMFKLLIKWGLLIILLSSFKMLYTTISISPTESSLHPKEKSIWLW